MLSPSNGSQSIIPLNINVFTVSNYKHTYANVISCDNAGRRPNGISTPNSIWGLYEFGTPLIIKLHNYICVCSCVCVYNELIYPFF